MFSGYGLTPRAAARCVHHPHVLLLTVPLSLCKRRRVRLSCFAVTCWVARLPHLRDHCGRQVWPDPPPLAVGFAALKPAPLLASPRLACCRWLSVCCRWCGSLVGCGRPCAAPNDPGMCSVLLPVFVSPFGSPSAAVCTAVSPSLLVACDPRLALGVWDACLC